jgi:hypothetical protein
MNCAVTQQNTVIGLTAHSFRSRIMFSGRTVQWTYIPLYWFKSYYSSPAQISCIETDLDFHLLWKKSFIRWLSSEILRRLVW